MSDVTVGPIQTYVNNLPTSSSTISQNPGQGSLSVTLADSTLWLVDTSKLNEKTSNPTTQITLMDLQTKYQTTVPFANVNFNAAAIAPAALMSQSSSLQSSLPQDNTLLLAAVTGGSQLSADGTSLASAGSSGSDPGGLTSVAASSGLFSASAGGGSGAGSPGAGGTSSGISIGVASNASPSAQTDQTAASVNPQTTSSAQATISSQPIVNAPPPAPVPFEVSPTLGLLLVLTIFGYKRLIKKTALKPILPCLRSPTSLRSRGSKKVENLGDLNAQTTDS